MAVTSKPLVTSQYAANSESTVYTAGTGTRTIIDKLTGYNVSGSAATLTVKLVPSGGTAGASHTIMAKTIAAGDPYTFPEIVGHVLEAGGIISLLASAANAIVVRISGRETT